MKPANLKRRHFSVFYIQWSTLNGHLSTAANSCDNHFSFLYSVVVVGGKRCTCFKLFHFSFQWKLICSKGYFVDLIQSVYMVGVLVGAVLFGPLSDIYGRRRVLFVCFLGQCIVSSLSAFPKSFPVFVGLRCIVGFFSQVKQQRKIRILQPRLHD